MIAATRVMRASSHAQLNRGCAVPSLSALAKLSSRPMGRAAALPVAEVADLAALAPAVKDVLQPPADYFNTLALPAPLIQWGHPGNMAVVLLAMGGYGGWLGWQIRTSSDGALIEKAKELHPKLSLGMFIFFALGASGGVMSLLMQGKPILESSHATTGLAGLGLLSVQALLPAFFSNSSLRTAHAFLGTGILGLFAVHAVLGLQLGLGL